MAGAGKRLKHHVCFDIKDGFAAVICGDLAIKLEPDAAELFHAHRAAGIAADFAKPVGENKATWGAFLGLCQELDLLFAPPRGRARNKLLPPEQVKELIQGAIAMWKPLPGFHKFFSTVEKSPWAMARYLLEMTYWVSKASEYLKPAAKNAPTAKLKKIFAKVEREERDHFKMLLKDLGLTQADLLLHDPAPGTHALFTQLFHLAVTDPRSLLVSLALFETEPKEREGIRSFYKSVSELTKLPTSRFVAHHMEDIEAGHSALWLSAFEGLGKISYAQGSKWLQDLHMTKHMVDLWHDSVLRECEGYGEEPFGGAKVTKNLIRTRPELFAVKEPDLE